MEGSVMKQTFRIAVIVALASGLLLSRGLLAQASRTAQVQFKAAQHKEEVKGDLKGAIEDYKKVVAGAGTNRALAVQALVRMAECYQKLGDREAQNIYQRILREYSDQSDAAVLARARLGATDSVASSKGDRPVWTGPNVDLFGTVSPDGRYLTYVDWGGAGNVVLRDLTASTDRPLTRNVAYGQFGQGMFSAISKDGKQVAYAWVNNAGGNELRIAPLEGTGVPEFRRILDNDDLDGISPYDWSPDGKQVAVHLKRKDLTGQIALVGVQDGTLRVLKSVDWRGPTKIFFSPDGRYVAYDLAVTDTNDEGHVYVLAVDGSRETAVVEDRSRNVIMGWSPDGGHLLFASDRTGSMTLWALAVVNGKAVAAPRVVKADIGSSWSLGSTDSGTMYVFKDNSTRYLRVASIDLGAGKPMAPSPRDFQRFIGSGGTPDWSRNGEFLSYKVCGAADAVPCTLAIASVATGRVRELQPKLRYFNGPRWSSDSQSVIVYGRDLKGRQGVYRVDAQTGDVSPVVVPRPGQLEQLAPDGKKIYYRLRIGLFERELESGVEREIFRHKGGSVSMALSPDGRYIGAVDRSDKSSTLLLIPIAGGEPRELLRASRPEQLDGFRMIWTPDSRAVIVPKLLSTDGERKQLWLVPVTDERPRKLDIDVDSWLMPGGGFQLRPDGGQVAFVAEAAGSGPEVWALENLLSLPSAKK
jgi:Tol biopolymer transport system component